MTITPQNTGIVLVHGGWHVTRHYTTLINGLEAKGYEVAAPQLPSTGDEPGLYADDLATIRAEIAKFTSAGKDVAILMHSYGGNPGSEAAKGLVKGEGPNAHGVVKLIYMCAFILPVGVSPAILADPPPDWMTTAADGHNYICLRSAEVFFNGVGDAGWVARAVADLKPFSRDAHHTAATWRATGAVSSAFLFCERDRAMLPVWQTLMVETGGIEEVARIDADHAPWESRPEETVKAVMDALAGTLGPL